MKECLDYDCKIPHHEFEEMEIRLEYSSHAEDVIVSIQVPDGGGREGKASRLYITASELREITFLVNKYIQARGIMEMDGGNNAH